MTAPDTSPPGDTASERSRGLLQSSATVGGMTLVSRVLGLIRDIVLARFLGAGMAADAFFMAFKLPQFLRRLFAEGAFAQAFVPVLSEYRQRHPREAVEALLNAVAGSLGSVLLGLTTLVVVAAPVFTALYAFGFFFNDPEKFALTSDLVRITFPYLFLISMTGFAGAVLNSYGRFAVPAITPAWLNVCLISGTLVGVTYLDQPVWALAWAVFLAGIIQLCFQLPFLAHLGLLPRRPVPNFRHEGVRRIMILMVPALFSVSVTQINLLLDTVLASFLPTGSISWLYYSDRVAELPLGVFGIAIATVILPSLSRDHTDASLAEFRHTLAWGVRMVLLIALPATVALWLLAEPILITLFQYRQTAPHDVHMAAFSLRAYTLGLTAFMLVKVLAPGYYSRQDTKTPVRIAIKALVANMGLNGVLVIPLHVFYRLGHMGLALATALAACLNAGLLWHGLRRDGTWQWPTAYRGTLWRLGVAVGVMAAWLLWWTGDTAGWLAADGLERSLRMAGLCVSGALVYFVALGLLGFDLRRALAQRRDR